VTADLPCEGERDVLEDSRRLLLSGGERRLSIAALNLDDREQLVKARRTGLQLEGPAGRPLGLIKPVESREITGEVVVPAGPQRIGGERLAGDRDRLLHLTDGGELNPKRVLRTAVVRRELRRTAILRFRPAPVEIGGYKHVTPGNVCSRKLGREAERAAGRRAPPRVRLLRRRGPHEITPPIGPEPPQPRARPRH